MLITYILSEPPTWSISMSLGKAFGHSMATLTMSAGGGMAEVGWAGGVGPAASPLLEVAHPNLQDKSEEKERMEGEREVDGNKKTGNRAH